MEPLPLLQNSGGEFLTQACHVSATKQTKRTTKSNQIKQFFRSIERERDKLEDNNLRQKKKKQRSISPNDVAGPQQILVSRKRLSAADTLLHEA